MYFFTIVGSFSPPNVTIWWDIMVSCFFPCLRKWFKKRNKTLPCECTWAKVMDIERYLCWGPQGCLYHPIANWEYFLKKSIANLLCDGSMINHWCCITSWFKESHFIWFSSHFIKRIGLAFLLFKKKNASYN
jgi:hypothetical protein